MDVDIEELGTIVGADHVVVDPAVTVSACVDWTGRFRGSTPAVVRPATTDEVAEIVRWCRQRQVAIVPQGGNTGLVGGATPMNGEIVLSTARLRGIDDVDADAGQLTAGAGETIAAVQGAARAVGWRYGVDFASRDSATIGGSIATNAGGLRAMRLGPTRRHLVGLEAVLGTGEVISRMNGLTKDNTGFDLAGLLCGSEGTLGVVTKARLALVAQPTATVTALIGLESVVDAVSVVGELRRAVPSLEAAELMLAAGADLVAEMTGAEPMLVPPPRVIVLVEAVGPPDPGPAMASVLERLAENAPVAVATDSVRAAELWHVREAHTESIARLGVPLKFDVTLPSTELAVFTEEIGSTVSKVNPSATTWLFGHIADGNVHVNVTGAPGHDVTAVEDAVLSAVVARGGSISAEHGIGRAKRNWLVRDRSAGDVAAMRAIKTALDPDNICNPGVLF